MTTTGKAAHGVQAVSRGGGGSNGGAGGVFYSGGAGSEGGAGGSVRLTSAATIDTSGADAYGLYAASLGGAAGEGGKGRSIVAVGGHGGANSRSSEVNLTNQGTVTTRGEASHGVFGQSIGGDGGTSVGARQGAIGGDGDSNSPNANGAALTVSNAGTITASGKSANGIVAQSIGGGGGNGGSAFGMYSLGGNGHSSGNGGTVNVSNAGRITTSGAGGYGIHAQSIGGGGGKATQSTAIGTLIPSIAHGGKGASGGDGGRVTISLTNDSTILTKGADATAIVAQSIGGGGGDGGTAGALGLVSIAAASWGGAAGASGHGSTVDITTRGRIETQGDGAGGVLAQSIGGGGGTGGDSTTAGISLVAVGTGGSAGGAGHGGKVFFNNYADILTNGTDAHGALLQSIGGGGGAGGNALALGTIALPYYSGNATAAIGGVGGVGGNAGSVDANNHKIIKTKGDGSRALVAQSIGGGGGSGGTAHATSISISLTSASLAVGLGRSGGSGGDGSTVQSHNSGQLETAGDHAAAMLIQSVGGGGGIGGSAVARSAAFGLKTFSASLAIGGRGGTGGNAGSVTLDQQGSIKTAGKQSPGVLGQSVGGGGGSGGLTHGDTRADTGSVAVSLGRSGGSGGDAGAVTITQRTGGWIETTGMASDGLVAQSVGGGGGIGGAVGDKNQPDWPPIPALPDGGGGFTASASLTLGGSGGAGGAGKTVTVTQNGRIETRGRQSSAVVAQSIGGGGGRAGSTATSAPGGTLGLSLTLGGSGGAGGDGGQVTVKQTGVILTSGMGSTGVLAQSIGGGGGAGSSSESTQSPGKVTANLSIGGSGGQGGDGGDVHLDHSGVIRSSASDALLVQSIGGGGGQAGAVYGGVNIDGTDAIRSLSPPEEGFAFTVTVGARGGNGGNGGTATVNNSGSLSSNGDTRAAATVQSIGGGGGTGGIASAFYDVSPLANQPVAQMSLALGGSGGAGGHGGSVTWKSTARTAGGGIMSDAIRLQSIGGGGGVAASQMAAVSRDDGPTGPTYRLTGAVVSLQGRGGSGGMGGNVTATQEARAHIETAGESSIGLLAQSVGGGGGISVAHFPQGAAKTGLNLGGGVGAGGKVTLNQSGIVETSHAGSHAILAQSVGGGGGATRVLGADQSTQIFNAAREGDGNGGTVAVAINSSGSIITAGIGSYGVLAQSIGGGGGYLNTGVWAAPAEGSLTQTHAGTGDGGSVTVEVAGSVRTRGDNSAAVFAQSVGGGGGIADGIAGRAGQDGKGSGGAVTIKINGLVEATGKNAHGVFAQSVGENNGNIQVTLSGTGLAQGGSGEAAGIRLSGGKGNQIRIGEQARVGALSDMAIRTAGGDTEITNAGNIRGSVWLQQSSPGKLTNSGSLAAGSRLDLAGGDLINNGVLTIGTGDALASSTLSGNLRQGVSGTYAPRVDFALARADMLAITGEAHLNGKLAINGMNHQPMQRDIEVLSAQSAYRVDPAFQVVDNAVFQYPTAWRDNRLHVGIKADFSAHNDVLSEDQGQLSSYLGRRWKGLEQQLAQSDAPAQVSAPATQTASSTTGSRSLSTLTRVAPTAAATRAVSLGVAPPEATSRTPTVAASTTSVSSGTAAPSPIAREAAKYTPVFDTIAQAPDAEAYADVLDQIANDAIQAPVTVMPLAHRMFLNRSLSCPMAGGAQAKPLDSACIWGDIEGNWLDRGDQHHDTGFSYESVRYMLGAQHPLGRGWVVGGGVSYEDARSKTDDSILKTTGHSVSGMAFLRKIDGPWTVTGALSAGYGSYDTHRAISTVSGVQRPNSDWNTHFASVRAQVAYTHQRESYYLKPALDVDVIYQRVPAYSEKGGGAFDLAFDSASAVRTMISPSMEFGGTLEVAQITMRPFVNVGLNWMPDNDWKTDARLKADRSGDSFRLSGSLPDVFAEYRVGMELETREGFVLRTEWRQRLADRYNERSAQLRLGMRF